MYHVAIHKTSPAISNVVVGGALAARARARGRAQHKGAEQARAEVFALVNAMGHHMSADGTVRREGPDSEDVDARAGVEEFMSMLAGGLAPASPHMISAMSLVLRRVMFEFRGATRGRRPSLQVLTRAQTRSAWGCTESCSQ
jgi:hypothetical protein